MIESLDLTQGCMWVVREQELRIISGFLDQATE